MSEPTLTINGGTASDEELVALLVALSTLAAPAEPLAAPPTSRWADRARGIGAPLRPGPGAWVASGRPH
ncbi:acyl-CoA carboxylase subunit epsilon [uncultured Friedmanniella sp.]|uniref:acyl-CoA carboxylase subunit epsilon n=1 Tax=uncultured Friedmanniella sp. TaxID=335381 RepID=UPI0035CB493C